MKKKNSNFTAVELFSGAVGPYGIHKAGIQSLLAVDFEENVKKVFEKNYMDEMYIPFLKGDVFALTAGKILEITKLKTGELFILVSTSPCQGFSISGLKNPMDEKNGLFLKSLELINELQPKFALLENVPGMGMPFMAPIFNEIKYRLKHDLVNYDVECKKVNALFFGAKQSRERFIFILKRKDVSIGNASLFPEPNIELARQQTIGNILPGIDGVFCGQSEKTVKLPNQYLNTVTAGQCFSILENGCKREPSLSELKVIAGLPESFDLSPVSYTQAYKIVGNAVPAQLMQTFGEHLIKIYNNENK